MSNYEAYIYIYIWCSKSQIPELIDFFVNKKKCNHNILVWCKKDPLPLGGSPFLNDLEYCLVFYESGCQFMQGCQNKHKWYMSSINKTDKAELDHPTIKPLEMVKRHILNSTKEGDIVFDCFLGSGTTAAAAKELNRHYLGFEINPEYYKIAVDRLNGITARDREKIDAGQKTIFDY